MRTPLPRRILIALIGLAVFAVPALLIKGVVGGKIDDANKAAGFQNIPANAIDIDDSQSLYRAENFDAALTALEEKAGDNPELLKVGVQPYMVEFQIKDGERAKGYRYYAKNAEMGEFKVKVIGSGSLEGSQFAYETMSEGITERLTAQVVKQDGDLRVTNMTIERAIIGGDLAWSVNTESDDRTGIVFQADPDGSGLADATERALDRSGAESGSATKDALSQADCLQEAGGEVAEVQACVE